MPTYSTNQFKAGLKLLIDNDPCNLLEVEFVKPGKGQAFTKTRFRNLKTGRVLERTYRSGETMEGADVIDTEMQFLYSDGSQWHFMVPDTYEQYQADEAAVADAAQWLKEEDLCQVTLWNGVPISITPPNFTVLRVSDTDPGVRGDTASGGGKSATLETGAVVRVPLFVEPDELIKVDTRTGAYVSRAKE